MKIVKVTVKFRTKRGNSWEQEWRHLKIYFVKQANLTWFVAHFLIKVNFEVTQVIYIKRYKKKLKIRYFNKRLLTIKNGFNRALQQVYQHKHVYFSCHMFDSVDNIIYIIAFYILHQVTIACFKFSIKNHIF